jgi:DNA-binding SARP family transcriptional activator
LHVGKLFCERKQCEQALTAYYRGIDVEPLHEAFYRGVMCCARCLQRPAEGLIAYERCAAVLRGTLGVAPAAETEALARALREPVF